MGEDFDPYFKWLGIPPEQQPPDHYRLLGVPVFTDDADVVSHAVDRLMAHLRTFQTGPKSAHSQKLLNEISAARVCLLNAEKKAEYDGQLRLELDAQQQQQQPADISAEVPGFSPTPPSLSPETSMAMDALPTTPQIRRTEGPTVASTRYRRQRRKKKILPVVFVLVLMVAVSLLGIVLHKVLSQSGNRAGPDPVFGGSTNGAKQQPGNSSKTMVPEKDYRRDEKSVAKDKPGSEVPRPAAPPDDTPPGDKPPDDSAPPDDKPPAKLPVPQESEIALVRDKLQSRIADESAPKLLQMAAERTTTDARKYVLLMTARDRAAEAGDYMTARDALQSLDRAYQVDLPALQSQNIAAVLAADSPATAWSDVGRDALRVSREAKQWGDVELAKRVATYALSAARKSGDTELTNEATLHYLSLE